MSSDQGIENNVNFGIGIKWRFFPWKNLKAEVQNVDYIVKILDDNNEDNNDDIDIESCDYWENMEECNDTSESSEAHPEILNSGASQPEFTGGGLQDRPFPASTKFRKEREILQSLPLQKATKFHYLCCCTLVLILLPHAESSFVEVPKNTVALKGESPEAIDMACKSDCQCNLLWFLYKNYSTEKEYLYNGYALRPDAKSYCTVNDCEPGVCHLNLANKPEAAKTYVCFEPVLLHESSADLIWLGDTICNDNSTEDRVNLTCSIEFRGNWAPIMEWKEQSSDGEKVLSVGINTDTVPNQLVTSTLIMDVQNGSRNYTCTTKFDISGKPRHTTATNIPEYTYSMFIRQQDKPAINKIKYGLMLGLLAICIVLLGVFLLIFIKWMKGCSLKCTQPRQTNREQGGGDGLL